MVLNGVSRWNSLCEPCDEVSVHVIDRRWIVVHWVVDLLSSSKIMSKAPVWSAVYSLQCCVGVTIAGPVDEYVVFIYESCKFLCLKNFVYIWRLIEANSAKFAVNLGIMCFLVLFDTHRKQWKLSGQRTKWVSFGGRPGPGISIHTYYTNCCVKFIVFARWQHCSRQRFVIFGCLCFLVFAGNMWKMFIKEGTNSLSGGSEGKSLYRMLWEDFVKSARSLWRSVITVDWWKTTPTQSSLGSAGCLLALLLVYIQSNLAILLE